MSFKTEEAARADLKKWKATLPNGGKGWTEDVWENMGWHWCLLLGPIRVGPKSYSEGFSALLAGDVDQSRHGSVKWTGDTDSDTPLGAAQKAAANFAAYAASERAMLDRMEKFLADNMPQ